MGRIPDEMAPCGVYCGVCPSFGRTCKGCGSDDMRQPRKSKWSCSLRTCCFERRDLDHCGKCPDHPCDLVRGKLLRPHADDPRYEYRRDTIASIHRVSEVGIRRWLEEEAARWACPDCGGRVLMHEYRCALCGRDVLGLVPPPRRCETV